MRFRRSLKSCSPGSVPPRQPTVTRSRMANAAIVLTLPQPSLPEHENSLLGALLLFPEKLKEVEDLYPSDFYGERTRILFQAMLDLDADGEPIDHLSLRDRIGEEVWERIGGYAWISALDL